MVTETHTNPCQESFGLVAAQNGGVDSLQPQDQHSPDAGGSGGDTPTEVCPASRHVRRTYEMWLRAQHTSS